MKQRFTLLALAATLVLTGATACSKKDDATPVPAITAALDMGSYKLDGQATTCHAKCFVAEDYDSNHQPIDKLFVYLAGGTNPTILNEFTTLTFTKPFGAAKSAYQLQQVNVRSQYGTPSYSRDYFSALRYSLTATSTGFAGNFEATASPSPAYPTSSSLTEGAFNAQY
jgi:hypothetical protein